MRQPWVLKLFGAAGLCHLDQHVLPKFFAPAAYIGKDISRDIRHLIIQYYTAGLSRSKIMHDFGRPSVVSCSETPRSPRLHVMMCAPLFRAWHFYSQQSRWLGRAKLPLCAVVMFREAQSHWVTKDRISRHGAGWRTRQCGSIQMEEY
jgi:hypothetical protein